MNDTQKQTVKYPKTKDKHYDSRSYSALSLPKLREFSLQNQHTHVYTQSSYQKICGSLYFCQNKIVFSEEGFSFYFADEV